MKTRACLLPVLAAAAAAGCAPQPEPGSTAAGAAAASASGAEAHPARALIQRKCSTCHTLEVALSGRRNAVQWGETLEIMVGHGMVATKEELRAMQDYLARHH